VTNLVYLLVVVSLTVVGSLWLVYRHNKPARRSVESGIDEFQRELRALAPEPPPGEPDRTA
jgi:hypothetical protein